MGKKLKKKSDEMQSWSRSPLDLNWGKYFNCACVFFANNKWELDGLDKKELSTLRSQFKKLLENHFWIYLDTIGSTSSPGRNKYNMDLSMKRSDEVLNFFKSTLGSERRFICGRVFHGEKYAKPQRRFHSVDRKVIVRVKIVMGRDPNSSYQEYERAFISRIKIFKRFSPHYQKWKKRGLDYLIEQWEKLNETGLEDKLQIKEKDLDKVIELLLERFPADIKNHFEVDLKNGNRMHVVNEYYHLLYRHDYIVAYNRYSQVDDVNIRAEILSQSY